jgi:8-oxo-(d)GTP phosphatase
MPEGAKKLLLMRHMSAGERLPSPALDRERPLDAKGRSDAGKLSATIAEHAVGRIVTSPHARCRESVEPIAHERGLEIECREALAPDASREDIFKLLEELPESALVCTHREVLEQIFDGEIKCEKGGVWVVDGRGERLVPIEYLPPPSSLARPRAIRR